MPEHVNNGADALKQLTAPARNHYFYGKLLDVLHFEMEQTYFNRKRWLLNRLGLGSGVLCGLEVTVAGDGQSVWVQPGVAIDPLGREIIVPAPYCLENPRQPTDAHGRPAGDPLEGAGVVTLCLAYHECETEPAPVLVGECDTREDCAPSTIRERYKLLLSEGEPDGRYGAIGEEQCAAIFPHAEVDDTFDRHRVACETLGGPCLAPEETCVVLATITLPANADEPLTLDACRYRTTVYSNGMLWELLSCLAARVDDCCRVRILRYVSGDGQTAEPGQALAEPLVVEVVDGDGNPVEGETITFRVRSGEGTAAPDSVASDASGRAQTQWTLGAREGLQTVEASIASGVHVVFFATAVAEEAGPPQCADFDDLEEGATFRVGDTFTSNGVDVSGRAFVWSNGESTEDGFARVESGGQSGGSGMDVQVNNINLAFDFGAALPALTLRFGEFGGNLNIEVNGDFRNFENFEDIDGETIGGASVQVTAGAGEQTGTLTLTGEINSFAIGGQELWIDDVCPAEVETAEPPVVTAVWPPNASSVNEQDEWLALWTEQPRLALTFDRRMNEDQLTDPAQVAAWLRVWQVEDQGEIIVRPLEMGLMELTDQFLDTQGFTAVYALRVEAVELPARYLIQMNARAGNITDESAPPLLLDAEFNGTRLTGAQRNRIWTIDEETVFGERDIWERLVDTGATLPQTGDGNEGGRFHGWFGAFVEQG